MKHDESSDKTSKNSSYAKLSNYNNASPGSMKLPSPPGLVTGSYIVPSYGSPGYNTLTHCTASDNCIGSYGTITSAYRSVDGNCGGAPFVNSLCQ